MGAHNCCSPAYASSISDCTPAARATAEPRGGRGHIIQQGRLTHTGFPTHHQRPALTGAHSVDQPVERLALASPAPQLRDSANGQTYRRLPSTAAPAPTQL